MKRHLSAALALIVTLSAAASGSPPVAAQPPGTATLPVPERFVQQTGLRVSLVLPGTTLRVGQDPSFRVRFENAGPNVLFLSPHVAPNLQITTIDGTPVRPLIHGMASRALLRITAKQLVRLEPRRSWEQAVPPMYHGDDLSSSAYYGEHCSCVEGDWALLLPEGDYMARFVYINAPGYPAEYDVYGMPAGVWEGQLETAPVSFRVVRPTREQLRQDESRMGPRKPQSVRRLFPLLALSLEDLVERLRSHPADRGEIYRILGVHHPAGSGRLLRAIDTLPTEARASAIYSAELSSVLSQRPDCGHLDFLVNELSSSRGDAFPVFHPVFQKSAGSCPLVGARLRQILSDRKGDVHARGNAAALLGTFVTAENEALLVDALRGDLTGARDRSSRSDDPVARGAAQGLAIMGSASARAALTNAFTDGHAAHVGPDLIARLAGLGQEDMVEPLMAALGSSDVQTVRAAIVSLGQIRSRDAATRVATFLSHVDPDVSAAAAHAVRQLGVPGFAPLMRRLVNHRNQDVQASALWYLADHGDPRDLELFLPRIESRNDSIGQIARMGIARFGTEAVFERLRKALDIPHGRVLGNVQEALRQLTFVDSRDIDTPQEWSSWWRAQRGRSRAEWARQAIEEVLAGGSSRAHWRAHVALSFLVQEGAERYRAEFERTAAGRHADLRIAAVKVLAATDRGRAARLLIKEFEGRLPGGCVSAHNALSELASRRAEHAACLDPAERRRLRAEWIRETAKW